jgi:hypothetical protein
MRDTGSSDDIHKALDVVLFWVGGWRIGIEAKGVLGARPATACSGNGNTEGGVAVLLGLDNVTTTVLPRKLLGLKGCNGVEGGKEVLVEAPVDFLSLPAESIYPLPPLLAARTRLNGLRALALHQDTGQVVLLFESSVLRDLA